MLAGNGHVNVKIEKRSCVWKTFIWNVSTFTCKTGKYLGNIVGDSITTCDNIIEVTKNSPTKTVLTKSTPTKTVSKNFNE